jgi:hypothetical protein
MSTTNIRFFFQFFIIPVVAHMSSSSKPIPIALPNELLDLVDHMAAELKMTKQDTMRLAMRIGLIDLRAAKDIASVIQQVATDKGESFLAWAKLQQAPAIPEPPPETEPEIQETTLDAAGMKLKLLTSKTAKTDPKSVLKWNQNDSRAAEESTAYKSKNTGTDD